MLRSFVLFVACLFMMVSCSSEKEEKTTYGVALDPTWFPLNVAGKRANLVAFSQELVKGVAKEEKIQVVLINDHWNT